MIGLLVGAIAGIASFVGGACSTIGGALAGVGSALAGGVSTLSSALTTLTTGFSRLIPTLGNVLSSTCGNICTSLKTFIMRSPQMNPTDLMGLVEKGFQILNAVAKILFPDQQMEQKEIGELVLQHPEVRKEDFDSTEAYLAALRRLGLKQREIPAGMDEQGWEFLCQTIGAGCQLNAISEKVKVSTPMDVFLDSAKVGLSATDLVNGEGGGLLEKMREGGVGDASRFSVELRSEADSSADGTGVSHGSNSIQDALSGFKAPTTGLTIPEMIKAYSKEP